MKTFDWMKEEEIECLVNSARGGVSDINDAIRSWISKRGKLLPCGYCSGDKMLPYDYCISGRVLAANVLFRLYPHRMENWLDKFFRMDFDVAVEEVVGDFQRSIDGGCDSAYYHLAVFCWEMRKACYLLSEGDDLEIDCDATKDCKCFSIEKAEEYHDLFLTNWQKALECWDPRALFDEVMHWEPWVKEHSLSQDQKSLFLLSAFNKGYPLAMYEYAKQLKDTNPEDYEKLMEKALRYQSVKSLHDFELEEDRRYEEERRFQERMERRRRWEYDESTPTLESELGEDGASDFWLNTTQW